MPPQLKYLIIALVAFFNVCGLVYIFDDTFDPPVKQAAIQQTVATQPPAQPPAQQTVYQPPVQPPAPTPQQLQQQKMIDDCNQLEASYYEILVTKASLRRWDLHQAFALPTSDKKNLYAEQAQLSQSMRESRTRWQEENRRCKQVSGWYPKKFIGNSDEYAYFRVDCDIRDNNYAGWFSSMTHMKSESEKNQYLTSRGEPPYQRFVADWRALVHECERNVPNWVTPAATKIAFERQAIPNR